LLRGPELGVVLARLQALLIERVKNCADHWALAIHAIRAEAQAVIGRHKTAVVDLTSQVELVLEGSLNAQAVLPRAIDHLMQERARAQVPWLAFERVQVAQQARFTLRIRQHGVRARVGH
jgi:hypothetical protein